MYSASVKGMFMTRYEAARNIIVPTIFYILILYRRDIIAWEEGVPKEELFWTNSYSLTTAIATFLYVVTAMFWSISAYASFKNYRRKKRNLKILLEEQAEWRKSGGEF